MFNYLQNEEAMFVLSNIEALSPTHCCREKKKCITCSECVLVALGIQHATRMRQTIRTIFFPHYLTKDAIFGKELLNTKCVFCFSLQMSEILFIRRTI